MSEEGRAEHKEEGNWRCVRAKSKDIGIPTVLDRLIQQALLQTLTPIFDPGFSEHSYGFRPGRRAHQAVQQAQKYILDGYRHVVDMDLEKFFDRVNHDVLMARVARKVQDKRVLKLLRRYLEAAVNGQRLLCPYRGRHTAGRADQPTFSQHHPGRPGQRTGAAGAQVRPLCGRLATFTLRVGALASGCYRVSNGLWKGSLS